MISLLQTKTAATTDGNFCKCDRPFSHIWEGPGNVSVSVAPVIVDISLVCRWCDYRCWKVLHGKGP